MDVPCCEVDPYASVFVVVPVSLRHCTFCVTALANCDSNWPDGDGGLGTALKTKSTVAGQVEARWRWSDRDSDI
jgi:hypothetical protein